ncbi:aspartyl-tRNA(Asn)/glutamyl-tRNA(Gln) amidotransferase subunit A [Sinosporangium album]|uniref:Aspartyl-tRNA(Asn)/glutamyl-tRNA(Gln) amidotransferase subunit A n=1 Tax=Sinosporangium album TaxID=504805 RepID=A0A1G7ZNF1_9ACTN|nr:amidase [Sinosporangium album]SDH10179.1 aspartyl-tRNA(Asn)/glutamyl-tRNA(Gln) amidotransferase subunit A [Sinosporangium album]
MAENIALPQPSVRELRRRLRAGRTTALESVERALAAIDAVDADLRSFIWVDRDGARAQARRVDAALAAGRDLPLAGVTVGVKDNIDVGGRVTQAGSRVLAGRVPTDDATVVARLRAAGAVIVGSTNMHEFAMGGTSENPHFGTVGNPLGAGLSAGGSSGGSAAAVAAGLTMVALGTDTCGSIRMPAALTGTVGLRPTAWSVPLHGVFPLALSMDTVGPITRTVDDNAEVFRVISGRDPRVRRRPEPDRLRLLPLPLDDVAEPVHETLAAVVERLRGRGRIDRTTDTGWVLDSIDVATTTYLREGADLHETWLPERADEYGSDVRGAFEQGALIPREDYLSAAAQRFELTRRALHALGTDGVLVLPTFPFTRLPQYADSVETAPGNLVERDAALVRYISAAAVTGLPSVSVTGGRDPDGLPIGIQLIGAPGTESALYGLARSIHDAGGDGRDDADYEDDADAEDLP